MASRTPILVLASAGLILWAGVWALVRSRASSPPVATSAAPRVDEPSPEPVALDAPVREVASVPAPAEESSGASASADTFLFCGRVLARESRRPIAGAVAGTASWAGPGTSVPNATTDADGRFVIRSRPTAFGYFEVSAAGFGPALVLLLPGHETPATAATILLGRAASLSFKIAESDGRPCPDVRITVTTQARSLGQDAGYSMDSLPDPQWPCATDAFGLATIRGLPSEVPLRLEAQRGGRILRREAEPVRLQPEENREIEWILGGGTRLVGRLTDPAGVAGTDVELWLLAADADRPMLFSRNFENRVSRRSRTDASGEFVIEDVAEGRWWLGPAPPGKSPDSAGPDAFAPVVAFVRVPPRTVEIRRDLTAPRGLYVRGRVIDPSGNPRGGSAVLATSDEITIHTSVSVDQEGSFAFGPLVPARYSLTAFGGLEFANSDAVVVSPGDPDIVLELKPAAVLAGKVVDGMTGAPCRAHLAITFPGPRGPSFMLAEAKQDGTFEVTGLSSGLCDVAATTEDGRAGVERGITLAPGASASRPVVHLFAGAKLRVRFSGRPHYGSYQILSDGVVVGVDSLENGASKAQGVPAGRLVVKFTVFDPTRTQVQEIVLAVGEEKEIAFTAD